MNSARTLLSRDGSDVPHSRAAWISLGLITVVAACLRFYGLGIQSLWDDELWTWRISHYDTFMRMMREGVLPDYHPPAWQIVIYLIQRYIGDSETALRFPSALCGTLAVPAVYLVASRLYSRREGLLAALFLAVLWFPLVESQEARAYSMLLLFTLLSVWFWLRMMDFPARTGKLLFRDCAGYVVCSALCAYLHYFGFFFVILQAIAALLLTLRRPRRLLIVLGIYAAVLLIYSPWLAVFLKHSSRYPSFLPRPRPATLLNYYEFCFNRSAWMLAVAGALWLALFGLFIYDMAAKKRSQSIAGDLLSPGLLLVLWLTVPVLGIYVRSQLATPVFAPRYLFFCAPAAYILLARAVARISVKPMIGTFVGAALAAFFLWHVIFAMRFYTQPYKEQFREAVGHIVTKMSEYPSPLVIGGATDQKHYDYYFIRHTGKTWPVYRGYRGRDIPEIARVLDAQKPRYVWFMFFDKRPESAFLNFLNDRFDRIELRQFLGGGLILFEDKQGDSQ